MIRKNKTYWRRLAKTSSVICLLAASTALTGCYSDDGNYDYRDPIDIRVEGIADTYTLSPNGERLQLHPQVTPSDRSYTYFWTLTPAAATTPTAVDTISTERDLDYEVNLRVGTYKLRFSAKDVATGVFAYQEYNVNVTTDMATGWWILKEQDNATDIDFFGTEKDKENLIRSVNGRSLPGAPVNLHYTPYFWTFNEATLTDETIGSVFVASAEDVVALDYFTGAILSNYEDLFVELPAQRRVQSMFAGPSDVHVCVDNVVWTMFNATSWKYYQFILKTLGDYQLSPYTCCSHATLPLLFDEKSSSFCTLSRNSAVVDYFNDRTGSVSPTNMGMDLLYLGGKSTDGTPADVALAVMQTQGQEDYWLLNMRGNPSTVSINPINSRTSLKPTLQMLHAEHRALNQNNNIIYFVKEGRLWSCNLDSQTEVAEDVSLGNGDEEVTYMEFLKYSPFRLNDSWFDRLVVATAVGDRYRVYLFPVTAGRLQPTDRVIEGYGRVKRACYMDQARTSTGSYVYTTTLF